MDNRRMAPRDTLVTAHLRVLGIGHNTDMRSRCPTKDRIEARELTRHKEPVILPPSANLEIRGAAEVSGNRISCRVVIESASPHRTS